MHERWTNNLPYIIENIRIKTPEQMAEELGCKLSELKLFLLRKRLFIIRNENNHILRILRKRVIYPEYFQPTARFYEATGIRRGRFWMLYRGEAIPTADELKAIARHLEIPSEEVIDWLQLELF
jgi:hypothetical protein